MLKLFKWKPAIKEPYALYLVIRDPRTRLHIKLYAFAVIGLIIAYALSPLKIIPGSIPVLGWMEDIILVPFALSMIEKFLPRGILAENRSKANKKVNRVVLKVVIGVVAFFALCAVTLVAVVLLTLKLING